MTLDESIKAGDAKLSAAVQGLLRDGVARIVQTAPAATVDAAVAELARDLVEWRTGTSNSIREQFGAPPLSKEAIDAEHGMTAGLAAFMVFGLRIEALFAQQQQRIEELSRRIDMLGEMRGFAAPTLTLVH